LKTSRTIAHTATIPVTENLPMAMYLRQELASGQADDGTPIEVAQTGPNIIIALGRFPNGRQFVVNLAEMAKAILTELATPSTTPAPEVKP
jgi:hypothetical protein